MQNLHSQTLPAIYNWWKNAIISKEEDLTFFLSTNELSDITEFEMQNLRA